MPEHDPFVITISRQLGSGGAQIGRTVAAELGIKYADRDILEHAAKVLHAPAEELEAREEYAPTFLEKILETYSFGGPESMCTPVLDVPSYAEMRVAESNVIREIATFHSAVIVGRAGYHLLRSHRRHLSVFVHADLGFRVQRVREVCGFSGEQALRHIEATDSARARYLLELTGQPWTDALQYDVTLCTSAVGLALAGQTICQLGRARFGPA